MDLSLCVDIPEKTLSVAIRLRLRARSDGARSVALDGADLLDVTAELPDGGALRYDGHKLHLTWERPFVADEERELTLRYRVLDPVAGVLFSSPDAARPDAPTFAATDHETERAHYWLAAVDHPSARPSLDIHLRADARLTLLANGAVIAEELHDDGTKTAHFSQRAGCPSYLTCFAVGDFVRWDSEPLDDIPIAAFALASFTPEHLERSFRRTRDMLAFMIRRLGAPYPFAKYYQFAVPGIGGAMENISLVSWDERFLLDATLELEERQLVDIINVHEMAHSWFGDHLVCRDFAHSWLKEGWATYMESVWLEEQEGPDAFAFALWNDARAYFAECDEKYRRPIVTRRYDSSFDLFDRHLYPGAALRIHMLRLRLGDKAFWSAVSDYLERHGGQLVDTDDFRRALERRSGLSLERFFDQWFHRPGFPDLEVSFRHDAEAGLGSFEIVQKQADEKTGDGAFEFELTLRADAARQVVHVSGRRTHAVMKLASAPDIVRVDPDGAVLHRLSFDPGSRQLEAQLTTSDVRGRIFAGTQLLQSAARQGVLAVWRAFEQEPYYGVRIAWAEALGKADSEAALAALLELAATHTDPKSLAAVFGALGKYRDARVTPTLLRRLEGELPYRAREAALGALGAQREQAPLDVLLEAARQPAYGGFAQSGALRALGATRKREALEPLRHALVPGNVPESVRPAAADGLGALALTLEEGPRKQAIEALIDALRDRSPGVQLAAARALGHAKATEARSALEALAERLAHQDAVRVRRLLRELAASGGERARQEELERLSERVRKLAAQVDALQARLGPSGEAS